MRVWVSCGLAVSDPDGVAGDVGGIEAGCVSPPCLFQRVSFVVVVHDIVGVVNVIHVVVLVVVIVPAVVVVDVGVRLLRVSLWGYFSRWHMRRSPTLLPKKHIPVRAASVRSSKFLGWIFPIIRPCRTSDKGRGFLFSALAGG